jgi:RHS repeat-associated protein
VRIVEYGPGVTATIQPSGNSYATFTTGSITLPAGSYSLTFQGLNPNGGDNIALVDSVTLNSTLVPNGSFESPTVTDYQTNPSDTAWSYTGSAGIAANANPSAPAGSQVAFVKNTGLLSQIWSASAGIYTLSFKVAQRGSNNDSHQQLRVNLRPSGSVISAKTFVWCGNQICEERDSTGSTVTKRFFADGEQRIGGSDAGNYYYSRDHLGSIREVTDSTGALKAQYDYDAWGNSVVVSGNMNVDFGYTGHYFHQPSGLNLAMYRAYNPMLGRWISRDPIGEAEGLNLYHYAWNDPTDRIDLLGLQSPAPGPAPTPIPPPPGFHHYGNWGGPGWANGGWNSESGPLPDPGSPRYVPPIDERDKCYEQHDRCIHNCPTSPNHGNGRVRQCDHELHDCLNNLRQRTIGSRFDSWLFGGPIPWLVH